MKDLLARTQVWRGHLAILLCLGFISGSLVFEAGLAQQKPDEQVRSRIQELMKEKALPSFATAVLKDGKVVYEECFGFADMENRVPATPETMYALASITKPLTATGLMTLVEQGLVDLDRPANDYLGEAKIVAHVGDASQATVKRLLLCTSGLPDHVNFFYAGESPQRPPMSEAIRRYGILVTAPGEAYTYSNFGYGILDYIIERVSGKTYPDFMKKEVFGPLGMKRSAVFVQPPPAGEVAVKYGDDRKPLPWCDFDHRGASAAYASLRDLARLALFISKHPLLDQKRILQDRTIDRMLQTTEPGIKEPLLRLGWTVLDHEGHRLIHASGGMPGAASRIGIVPDQGLIIISLANAYNVVLWEVEKAAFRAYLPGYAEKTKDKKPEASQAPQKFIPPAELVAQWSGSIKTYEGDIPVQLAIAADGNLTLKLDGRSLMVIPMPAGLEDLNLGFRSGVLTFPVLGNIRTSDASRGRHILVAFLRVRGNKLNGHISAASMEYKFLFPYWAELSKNGG